MIITTRRVRGPQTACADGDRWYGPAEQRWARALPDTQEYETARTAALAQRETIRIRDNLRK